jgi:Na+/proline symporter
LSSIVAGAIAISIFNTLFWIGTLILSVSFYYSSPKANIIGSYMMSIAQAIGLTQLLYVIPLVLYLKRQRRWGWMKGVIIGACLTALVNGGCWLAILRPGFR